MRVAFPLIRSPGWTGGHHYLVNLITALTVHQPGEVTPVLFCGNDVSDLDDKSLSRITAVEIIHSAFLDQSRKNNSLARAVLLGRDPAISRLFDLHRIDVVFEPATYFGWRLGKPVIAWFPDFQHRTLPKMFSRRAFWKREIGYRLQIMSRRAIMVSSQDALHTCERLYPTTSGRIRAVRFAVPSTPLGSALDERAIADRYGLPLRYFYMPNQFWEHKNHLLVLEALALLRERGVEVVVAASGLELEPRNPNHIPRLRSRIGQLGLEQQFKVLGLIPYAHVAALMRASVAMLNPSLSEGWSTTVEEARSNGVPLVLSDLAVHKEQAGDGAIYFERTSASSLAAALQAADKANTWDREYRTKRAAVEAAQRVQRFAQEFVRLVQQCANRNLRSQAPTFLR